ncbi:hypothetical protein ACGFNX_27880 [Streptomyces sp. NPDC048723]|uniref:hypothetical protein n=1 Tax=Streptomyces sp. NPDC048723 TaxID=3365589 RepID=UPI00371EADE5
MEMNRSMARLLGRVDTEGITPDETPPEFLRIAEGGWEVTPGGAHVLSALKSAPPGPFSDVVHEEYTVNGRGMTDHDLPASGEERESRLLRRCVAYAGSALLRADALRSTVEISAYVSLSYGGLADDHLTANVTFCGDHPGVPPYAADLEAFATEALLRLRRTGEPPWSLRGLPSRRRQWRTAGEVPEGSGTGRQLDLMRRLSRAEIEPARFAQQWLDARRKALNEDERIEEHLERALNQVFYALDEYPIDPASREDGDTTDAELLGIVDRTLAWIDAAGDRRRPPPPPAPLFGSAPLHTAAPAP